MSRAGFACLAIVLATPIVVGFQAQALPGSGPPTPTTFRVPSDAALVRFPGDEQQVLIPATVGGIEGRDTTGLLLFDTGSRYPAFDTRLMELLGVVGTNVPDPDAPAVLPRLSIGGFRRDRVAPLGVVDGQVLQRLTDARVIGLLGNSVLAATAVMIDSRAGVGLILPLDGSVRDGAAFADAEAIARSRESLGDGVSGSVPVRFRIENHRIFVRARISDPASPESGMDVNLLVDTGARKTTLFPSMILGELPALAAWPRARGLVAGTLFGDDESEVVRLPSLAMPGPVRTIERRGMDAILIEGRIRTHAQEGAAGPVHGLLGYSFLKHFRYVIDYPHRVLWLEELPQDWDGRRHEYSHAGFLVHGTPADLRVLCVFDGSPAARAGVRVDDQLLEVDGRPVAQTRVIETVRRLEGPPRTRVEIKLRRGETVRMFRLRREQLL